MTNEEQNPSWQPVALNNNGDVLFSNRYDSFLYRNGSVTKLPKSDDGYSPSAITMNDAGAILGMYGPGDYCIFQNEKLSDLNPMIENLSEWESLWLWDMNNKCEMVGTGEIQGQIHLVKLVPVQ